MTLPAAGSDRRYPVIVECFKPDFNRLAEAVEERLLQITRVRHCLYLNPIVTITCAIASDEFYSTVERYRRICCRRVKQGVHPRTCRNADAWSASRPDESRDESLWNYSLVFKGILFIDGKRKRLPYVGRQACR